MEIEEYRIRTTRDAPEVRFLYIASFLTSNDWRTVQDLKTCKINYFVKGHSSIIVNGKAYAVNAGDVLLYRPHELHYGHIAYPQDVEYFEFQFEPDALSGLTGGTELAEWYTRTGEMFHTLMKLNVEHGRTLQENLYRLLVRVRDPEEMPVACLALLIEILCSIRRFATPASPVRENGYYPLPLVSAMDIIHRRFAEKISNADIADAVSVSPSYLNRLFRTYLACTPHDYLLSCRISEASKCLLGGMSVTDACYTSGFQDISTFGAVFRHIVGVSPSRFGK